MESGTRRNWQFAVPTKADGTADVDKIKSGFVRGRDSPPPRRSPSNGECRHCQLSARCYKEQHSLWHPAKCGGPKGIRKVRKITKFCRKTMI